MWRVAASHPCGQHLQGGELIMTADERRLAVGSADTAGVLLEQAERAPAGDRVSLALQLERLELAILDHVARCPLRALADGDRARAGAGLQARGDIHGVADHRVAVAD